MKAYICPINLSSLRLRVVGYNKSVPVWARVHNRLLKFFSLLNQRTYDIDNNSVGRKGDFDSDFVC
jgi:hypothetical protein